MALKVLESLVKRNRRKDEVTEDRYNTSSLYIRLDTLCKEYLTSSDDILEVEVMPKSIDAALAVLESQAFQELYEFEQISETLFRIKLHEMDLF